MRLSLDGTWAVTAVGRHSDAPPSFVDRVFAATVPGCIHTDLLAAGAISDPFDADNEARYAWIGRTVWRYERTFFWQPDDAEHVDLVADGLDTFATVELNGVVIAQTANQHRSYRFDITTSLIGGENTIAITFAAPLDEAEKREREHGGELPHVNTHPYNAVRKMASNFGWDWGIDAPTSGIDKSIGIERWSTCRIASVRPLVEVIDGVGILSAHVELQTTTARPVGVTVRLSLGGDIVGRARALVEGSGVVRVAVPHVQLWWPREYGAQPLYDVSVSIDGGRDGVDGDEFDRADGADVDTRGASSRQWRGRVGFRTVELDTTIDADGNPFTVRINGRRVLIRGANWIPDHAFLTEIDRARYSRRIADATEANVNLLRVWGGGIYESDDFYDLCDERGVLVWQDMLFACAAYAEEPWMANEVEAEVREAVTRLSPHPSLVLWNGNNENYMAYTEWGWRSQLAGRTWGDGFYTELFPRLLAELDPTRAYTPGSPFSFDPYHRPNEDGNGSVHIWDVWNEKDYTAYREWKPRFVAEFGFQGPPAWSTLTRVVHDDPLEPSGPQMLVHQKAEHGNDKLRRGMLGHLPEALTIEDWHFSTQLNQAHAIRFGVEYFRSLTPYNSGTILWQLNDSWPVISWSAVDFDGHRKPVWYSLRAAYAPRLATLQLESPGTGDRKVVGAGGAEGVILVLINDSPEDFDGEVRIDRCRLGGEVLASGTISTSVAAWSTARIRIARELAKCQQAADEVLVATASSHFDRVILNYAEVVDQNLEPDALVASCRPIAGGQLVTVTATSFVRDVVVLADKVDPSATVDNGMISLLAGESAEFRVLMTSGGSDALVSPHVLRCANQLGARR